MDTTAEIEKSNVLPPAIVVDCRDSSLDDLLTKEWLLANHIGAYASSTVIGCNTRRYHGLLVAATSPPVGRVVALATVMERLIVGQDVYELATNEFPDAFSPQGVVHLAEFRNDVAPTFVFRLGGTHLGPNGELELTKRIILSERKNAVAVQYTLRSFSGDLTEPAELQLRPFVALRDFHYLRQARKLRQMMFQTAGGEVIVQDRKTAEVSGGNLHLLSQEATFKADPQWWYRFRYRADIARGMGGLEDLYSPGVFKYELKEGQSVQFNASLGEPVSVGFDTTLRRRRARLVELSGSLSNPADETSRRLAAATDAFIVRRSFRSAAPSEPSAPSATVLAGYHWFADWGRDTFVALPGLLLCRDKERLQEARHIFSTFVRHLSEGMIPNRFDDYSAAPHYNSIDASLWFIVAAERYLAVTGDTTFWRDVLMPAAEAILSAYQAGTLFDIHVDADGLLTGGSAKTQLTWMDAKLGEEVITPRHGKTVEVNALWHSAQRIMATRCKGINDALADHYAAQAELIASTFVRKFWNARANCLYDCLIDEIVADASIRPNQIFAVSLPHSPLSAEQQAAVLRAATEKLLTPYGLRTLSPDDPRYRGQCTGSWESRDRAYHQGTVWAWLLGAYIEAYLKVEGHKPFAIQRAKEMLAAFDGHLLEAGLGYVSEIFDGDWPHTPRGCIAQAWSVAEILRAKQLVAEYESRLRR